MSSLPVLNGCCTIQIYKKVSGCNCQPHSIVWEIRGNTLISAACFPVLSLERWLLTKSGKLHYVGRVIKVNRKSINIMMAREVLGLPRGAGHRNDEAEHKSHDTLDNTFENLRVATQSQNKMNRSKVANTSCRFKGVCKRIHGFEPAVRYNGNQVYLGTYYTDVEAALAHFYAGTLLHEEYFHGTEIPQDEMPSEERQEAVWQLVLAKLRKAGILAEA